MRLKSFAIVVVGILWAAAVAQSAKRASSAACDRACLERFVNQYLEALVARDPFGLPLAPKIKFSENDQQLPFGDGLWNTATGLGTYKLYVADPQAGQVAFIGTLRENGTPIALALRLKIENRRISEAETLVVREEASAKNIEALGQPDPVFRETASSTERASRRDLIAIANKYFEGVERGSGDIVPFDPDCNRIQNGTQTTNNSNVKYPSESWNVLALGCKDQINTKFFTFIEKVHPRRFLVVDDERNLVFGFFMFQIPGTVKSVDVAGHGIVPMDPSNLSPYTLDVAELYKIKVGRIRKIEALQTRLPYGTPSPFER